MKFFAQSPVSVVAEGGHFYLESDEFKDFDNHQAVRAAVEARRCAKRYDAAARPHPPERARGPCTRAHEDGRRTTQVIIVDSIVNRSKVMAPMVVGGTPAPPQPDVAAKWMTIALRDSDVMAALEIWGNTPHDWVSLNKVYEIVESRGGLSVTVVSRNEARRFKHTANHQNAAGADAGYARRGTAPRRTSCGCPTPNASFTFFSRRG